MKAIFRNTQIIVEEFNSDYSYLSSIFTNFDAAKHANFMQAIGGRNGSIWQKIRLLYMPVYSTPEDGNIYYNLKSDTIWGRLPEEARLMWQPSADVNNSNLKGYKETLVSGKSVVIKLTNRGYTLTPSNICFFCLSAHNPNPNNSIVDARMTVQDDNSAWTLQYRNLYDYYQINSPGVSEGGFDIQQTKTVKGFSKTMAICSSNVDGLMTIVSNNGNNTSGQVSGFDGHVVTGLWPCGRERSDATIYGELFTIQGLAEGLTVQEAEQMVSALGLFLE